MKELEKLYRIWDIKEEKYYSTGKKSIWKSKSWAVAAVKTFCDESKSYRNIRIDPKNFEIHTIQQVVELTEPVDILLMAADEKKRMIAEAERNVSDLQKEVSKMVGGLPFYSVKDLYTQRLLAEDVINIIRPKMSLIAEYSRFLR